MRCAIFVDAGYLIAAAGELCLGTHDRSRIQCAYQPLVDALVSRVRSHFPGEVLRLYWYDGAKNRIPNRDHQEIASLPYVKVRLGNISGSRQKGVDALIFRDMLTLSRERAIARAYLLTGDEDLREAVASCQDMGVQVILMGVSSAKPGQRNQSELLRSEADELIELDKDFLSPHFSPAHFSRAELEAEPAEKIVDPQWAEYVGTEFGDSWARQASGEELQRLMQERPKIPRPLDVQLLMFAESRLGISLLDKQVLKKAIRRGFWRAVALYAR